MRVLYLTMNPNRASTTVPTEGWFRFLRPRGLDPVLVSHELGEFHAWSVGEGIPACHIALPFPDKWKPFHFTASLWRLRKLVKQYRIRLIHCNEHNIYPIGQYLAKLCRLPIVVSVHFTMGRGFCEWAFGGRRGPDRMYFVSGRSLQACVPELAGVVAEDVRKVLHNGLDMSKYRCHPQLGSRFRQEWGLGSELLIGAACALRPRKQLDHLFQAASRIASPNFKLILAGAPVPGDEEYSAQLLRDGKRLLKDRLVHVGHLPDLRPFCNALDLFVNTSREESFGISVLEAMACGCPVVGYDSKAVDEVVLPDGGEMVGQDNLEQLTEVMQRWLADPAALREGRVKARQQAEKFDIRAISETLWDDYSSILQGRDKITARTAWSHMDCAD